MLAAGALAGVAAAQDGAAKPETRLLDEMSRPECERLQAAMDMAGAELSNNPMDRLFAVVYPGRGEKFRTEYAAAQIDAWVHNRHFDKTRIVIAIGSQRDETRVELIAVPPGADDPATERIWERKSRFADARPGTKAILVTSDVEDENPCFHQESAVADLADFLKENPEARVKIVVKTSTVKEFNEAAKDIRQTISKIKGAGPSQIRIVYVRSLKWPKAPISETEYWLLPSRARK